MSEPSRLIVLVGLSLVVLLAPALRPETVGSEPAVKATSDDEAVLKRIVDNWRIRKQRAKSLYFAWDYRVTAPQRSGTGTVNGRMELWMDGESRIRLVEWRISQNGKTPATPKIISEYTFDGVTSRRLDLWSRPATGEVWNGMDSERLDGIVISPLILALRPLSRGRDEQTQPKLHVSSRNAIIGGTRGVKLQREVSGTVEDFWVDPARGDIILGWKRVGGRSPSVLASVDYRNDPKVGWIPSGSKRKDDSSARGDASSVCTVNHFAINQAYPIDTFRLTFPAGTAVFDRTLNEAYQVAKDGSKSNVLKFDSPSSVKVYQTLDQFTDFVIDPEPLKDALDFVSQRYQIKITLKGQIDKTIEVQVPTAGIKGRQVIELLLKQSRPPLTFEIRNGALVVFPSRGPQKSPGRREAGFR